MTETRRLSAGLTNVVAIVLGLLSLSALAQDQSATGSPEDRKVGFREAEGLGGLATPRSQLAEDDVLRDPLFRFPSIDKTFGPWLDTKKRVNDEHGLAFGIDYNTLFQGLSDSLTGEDKGNLGILRFYGLWDLFESEAGDTGSLSFKIDHRHRWFRDLAPSDLASQAGYIGVTGTLFSDTDGLTLIDFNWQQTFSNRNAGIIIGRFDPNDYMGVLGYVNPWTTFSNVSTLLNSSVAFPDASIGIGGGTWFADQWYVKGTINDANGVVTETDAFSGGSEFFKFVELGWSPTKADRYFKNVHVVAWDVDERKDAGIEAAHGVMIGANWTTADQRWMGFVRGGWSSGTAPIYNETYTTGFLRKFRRNSDLLGIALNWGDVPGNLGSQTTGEMFYRLQFSQNFAITPSIQLLRDPALNDQHGKVWVFSVRMRLTL